MKLEELEQFVPKPTTKTRLDDVVVKAAKVLLAEEFVKCADSPKEVMFHVHRLLIQAEGMKVLFIASMAGNAEAQMEAIEFLQSAQELGARAGNELNREFLERHRG